MSKELENKHFKPIYKIGEILVLREILKAPISDGGKKYYPGTCVTVTKNKNAPKVPTPGYVHCEMDDGHEYCLQESDVKREGMISKDYIPYEFTPNRIIFAPNNTTIVFWKDGTKTVVRLSEGEKYSYYHAFTAALAKHIYGNNSRIEWIIQQGEGYTDGRDGQDQES